MGTDTTHTQNEKEAIEDEIDDALSALLDAEQEEDDFQDSDDEDDEDEDLQEHEEDEDEDEFINDRNFLDSGPKAKRSRHNYEPNSSSNSIETEIDKSSPKNFSKIDNSALSQVEIDQRFPLFKEAQPQKIEFELEAGQMLYLPCGWFHEVKSVNATDDTHLAFNYWFHPPDKLDNFEHPYSTSFWKEDFLLRGGEKSV